MSRAIKNIANGLTIIIIALLITGCVSRPHPSMSSGITWRIASFSSNGERIYFTAASERGTEITYTGGKSSNNWMMGDGQVTCASCHGSDGKGGNRGMGMMQGVDAKDIRWSVLQNEFDAEKFRLAVTEGQDPDGTQLSTDMPLWNIGDEDLADLIAYLKTLP